MFIGFVFLVEGSDSDLAILASGKTPSAAKHTIGCTSPDDIDTNPGLSKTMAREPSY